MIGSSLRGRDRSPDPQLLEPGELTPVHQRASRCLREDLPEFEPLPTAMTMQAMSTADTATTPSPATSSDLVVYPPRVPKSFHGDIYEDVEDWLEHFERVADANN